MQDKALTLAEYIAVYFGGSQRKFAEAQGVLPQQVTQWLNKDYMVVNHNLYSLRRELNMKIIVKSDTKDLKTAAGRKIGKALLENSACKLILEKKKES